MRMLGAETLNVLSMLSMHSLRLVITLRAQRFWRWAIEGSQSRKAKADVLSLLRSIISGRLVLSRISRAQMHVVTIY